MAIEIERWRFTVDDYERMGRAGILGEDDRVELIAGEIVKMSPIGGVHVGSVNALNGILVRHVGETAIVSVQNPIRLSNDAEPQPDLVALRRRAYGGELPTAADVLLLIEVADTTYTYDRNVKLPLYARAGIPEVWTVNVANQRLERYSDPDEGEYRLVRHAGRGESLASTVLPDLVFEADAILG